MFFRKISAKKADESVGEVDINRYKSPITYDSVVNTCDPNCNFTFMDWSCIGTCQSCSDTCACHSAQESEPINDSLSTPRP